MAEKTGPIIFKVPKAKLDPKAASERAAELNADFIDTVHAALTKDGDTVEITGKHEGPP